MTEFSFPPPPPPPPKATSNKDRTDSSSRGRGASYNGHGFRSRGSSRGDRGRGSGIRGMRASRGAFSHNSSTHSDPLIHSSTSQYPPQSNHIGEKRKSQADHYGSQQPARAAKSNGHFNARPHLTTARQKVESAPAVPNFGFALPLPVLSSGASQESKRPISSNKIQEKNKSLLAHNQLGLTPNVGDEEFSEDDEGEDEEARFAETGPIKFEHQGRTWTLSSPDEWKAWVEERRSRWPTKNRVEEKKWADAERMRLREEATKRAREAKLREEQDAKRKRVEESLQRRTKTQAVGGDTELDPQPKTAVQGRREREEEKILKAKKELEKSIHRTRKIQERLSKFQALSESNDFAVDGVGRSEQATDHGESPARTSHPHGSSKAVGELPGESPERETLDETKGGMLDEPDPTSATSSSSSDDESDTDSSSSSPDAPDEESAQARKLIRVPPPPRQSDRGPCSFWMQGKCRNGRQCKFSHAADPRPESTSQQGARAENDRDTTRTRRTRKRLYERLVEQERAAEEMQLLKAIKALGDQGFLDA